MMGDVDEKYRGVETLLCLKEEVIEEWEKGLLMTVGKEEEKRGATWKAEADRAQVEVTMRGIDRSGAAIAGCCVWTVSKTETCERIETGEERHLAGTQFPLSLSRDQPINNLKQGQTAG